MGANGIDNARELEIHTIQGIMSTEGGRDFMFRIIQQTGLTSDTFDHDTHVHARNAGQRSVGLWLQGELMEASIDNYLKMIKEHIDE